MVPQHKDVQGEPGKLLKGPRDDEEGQAARERHPDPHDGHRLLHDAPHPPGADHPGHRVGVPSAVFCLWDQDDGGRVGKRWGSDGEARPLAAGSGCFAAGKR